MNEMHKFKIKKIFDSGLVGRRELRNFIFKTEMYIEKDLKYSGNKKPLKIVFK